MPKKITAKARAKYLENRGRHCPFCNSGTIEGEVTRYEYDDPTQEVKCLECGKRWLDTLGPVDVEEITN